MRLSTSDRRRLLSSWCFFAFLGVRFPGVSACILLLNGWEPLSLRERAVLAEVVVGARTLATYKEERTPEARTYTATFRIFSVLKGGDLLDTIDREPGSRRNVFNVSNFGDKTMCYADVVDGESYLLFLTLFGGRLSAKYDDLFGAAADYDDDSEAEILAAIANSISIDDDRNDIGHITCYHGDYKSTITPMTIMRTYNDNKDDKDECYSNYSDDNLINNDGL
ncbi:hypothetical protein LSAT2_021197 [Lamellibrachia satsuma]|nr:hypothetical protein LSAT2_021197 [Lamellibrachia satsuma]